MNSKIVQGQITYEKINVSDNLKYFKPSISKKQKTFSEEISISLSKIPKSISPKYFYDKYGSELFDKICL